MLVKTSLLLLFLAAGPAAAQLADKQSVAQANAAAKVALADLNSHVQATTAGLQEILGNVKHAVEQSAYTQANFDTIRDTLMTSQAQLRDDAEAVGATYMHELGTTLAQAPLAFQGLYTASLYRGAHGAFDAFEDKLARRIEKAASVMRKLMAGLAKFLEKKNGVAMTCRIEPPVRAIEGLANGYDPYEAVPNPGLTLTIDTLLAASSLAVQGDGRLAIAGSGDAANGHVHVAISTDGDFTELVQLVLPDLAMRRWTATFTGLPEGNYLVRVRQADTISQVDRVFSSIGIR